MVRSMTGFGRGVGEANGVVLRAEMRSVNHRYLEVRANLPPSLFLLDAAVQEVVQGRLVRGRVEVMVRPDSRSLALTTVRPDLALAKSYLDALSRLADSLHLPGPIDVMGLAAFKDVIVGDQAGDAIAAAEASVRVAVGQALDELVAVRETEGARLTADLIARLALLETLAGQVDAQLPAQENRTRARLETRVRELLEAAGRSADEIDEARLMTEVALIAERSDASEEMVRLRSHLALMRELLSGDGPVGRKADFFCQELLREFNTLGSKCADVEVTNLVVEMKTELERVREQVQNLE